MQDAPPPQAAAEVVAPPVSSVAERPAGGSPSVDGRRPGLMERIPPHWAALAALALAAFGLWQWYATRGEFNRTRDEIALRLRDADAEARASRLASKESQDLVREADKRIAALEAKLAESQSQQYALEAMYSELARGRDDWVLAEIDQTLSIAARELQLAGNVPGALAALQAADARIARLDRPQFQGLRKVIQRDIERLRAAPTLDVIGLTARLDQLAASIDSLPLLAEGRPQPEVDQTAPAPKPWWSRFGESLWSEIKSLVRVQRLDAQDQSLVSPDQAWFLRETMKLRLMHARVALLQRNEAAYRADLKAATDWLSRYFDPRDKRVAAALATLGQLNAATLSVELPAISESLAAVRSARAPRERGGG